MKETIIAQGAEATITRQEKVILKDRVKKGYRHPELDEKIRKGRTKHEAKLLVKAQEADMHVPEVFHLNKKNEPKEKYTLTIAYIEGDKIADSLNTYNTKKQQTVMQKIGKEIQKMHDAHIIHADLTTSNMLLKDNTVYIIDFGLGYISHKIEDKAVDIHVLKQALEAKHWENHKSLFNNFLKAYNPKEKEKIIERLTAVERRGRYKKGS